MSRSLFPELDRPKGRSSRRRKSRPRIVTVDGSFLSSAVARITQAGGVPVVLSKRERPETLRHLAMDGLLLLGGRDIDPALYGEENRASQPPDPARDRLEVALAERALLEEIPTLAICRGHQLLATVAGGYLWQDMEGDLGVSHDGSHLVYLREGRLRKLFGWETTPVNSYHHQAVATVPNGFRLSAVSPDGIIEALETDFAISTQWHPEILEGHRILFEWLIAMARLRTDRI